MAIKRVKVKEGEKLTPFSIEKVIRLLEADKPISKKDACELLNISYNTARLAKIIEQFKEEKFLDEKRRAANRGKPAASHEIQSVVQGYLDGDSFADIAERLYRPVSFVKKIVEDIGVPGRANTGYFQPEALPEKCISETFRIGEIIWSSRHNAMAIVRQEYIKEDTTQYQIYVIEPIEEPSPFFPQYQDYGGFYATIASYDLGKLEHLKEYGIDVYKPYRGTFGKWLEGR